MEDRARGFGFRLSARPGAAARLPGAERLLAQVEREGFASLYYSFTRLATEGTVTLAGETWRVRGTSWMDREIGSSQLAPAQVGWDWFALHLAGRPRPHALPLAPPGRQHRLRPWNARGAGRRGPLALGERAHGPVRPHLDQRGHPGHLSGALAD